MMLSIIIVAAFSFSSQVTAQLIQISNFACQGQPCSGAAVIAATDNSAISVLFSDFKVELRMPPNLSRVRDQKTT